ncbi:MAG: hypothetical protein FJ025_05010 [Chloroflexi bacterium]|nr:hypothetical protein [Chloroflexota bacterium]
MGNSRKINKKEIGRLLSQWSQEFTVFVPSRENGIAMWAKWDGKDTSFLDWYRNTVVPAKSCFLPSQEKMFGFQKQSTGYNIEPPSLNGRRRLLFGIRPCDAKALALLDMTFKDAYEDPYYISKRNNTILVGLGCTKPSDSCFCLSLKISPSESNDVDLMLTDIGDQLCLEAVTDKGKRLMESFQGLEEVAKADETKLVKAKEAPFWKVSRRVNTENIEEKLLSSFEDNDYWEKAAAKCVSCGVCTFLCPTCHCFDINDEVTKKHGARFRSWDSCSFSIYTKMPMENPREEKWHRVRQKVCHKYEFYPMNFGAIACTGCGRCIRLCPVNWDITHVLGKLPAKV